MCSALFAWCWKISASQWKSASSACLLRVDFHHVPTPLSGLLGLALRRIKKRIKWNYILLYYSFFFSYLSHPWDISSTAAISSLLCLSPRGRPTLQPRYNRGIFYSGGCWESREFNKELGLKLCLEFDEYFTGNSPQWHLKLQKNRKKLWIFLLLSCQSHCHLIQ